MMRALTGLQGDTLSKNAFNESYISTGQCEIRSRYSRNSADAGLRQEGGVTDGKSRSSISGFLREVPGGQLPVQKTRHHRNI